MKIRTDFVTNSSSSSFVAITIKGELFSKIIEKNQNALHGFFSEENDFYGGKIEINNDTVIIKQSDLQDGMARYVPENKSEIISIFASMLGYDNIKKKDDLEEKNGDEGILSLLTELFQNSDDIVKTIETVNWTGKDDYYGEFADSPSLTREFTYSVQDGEKFIKVEEENEDWDF